MKNKIYFFTGTGNSLKVAEEITKTLPNCELTAICKNTSLEISANYERIGFIFPNYSGGLPKMVSEFIKKIKLPTQNDTYLFVISTYGGFEGNVLSQTQEQFKQKNWTLHFATSILSYPNAVTKYPMIRGIKLFTKLSASKTQKVINKVLNKQHNPIPLLTETSKSYKKFINTTHESDQGFHTNDDCIACQICTKICPAQNITIDNETDKPKFHHQCESCQACIQHCPKQAINYNNKTQKRRRYNHPDIPHHKIIKYYKQ